MLLTALGGRVQGVLLVPLAKPLNPAHSLGAMHRSLVRPLQADISLNGPTEGIPLLS